MQILERFRQMVLDGPVQRPVAFKDSKEVSVAAAECMRGEQSERDGGVLVTEHHGNGRLSKYFDIYSG